MLHAGEEAEDRLSMRRASHRIDNMQNMASPRINDFVIKIASVNGTGSASANSLLMKSIFRSGIPVMGKNYFPSNIQGLPTWYEIRVSKHGYVARSGRVDIMVAMNAETYARDLDVPDDESMVKRMQHGFASRNGLTAAALAAAGYVGIKRVFERPYGGWLAVFGEGHRTYPEDIYKGLGVLWETERIAVKAYSCMGLLHAAIDAALELRPKVDVSQIQRIDIDMPEAAYAHGGWKAERPLEVIGAQMNVAYVVAVALLDGDVLIDQFTKDRINSDDVWALIDKTLTHHERAYDHLPIDEQLTTQVRLTFNDGSTRAAKVVHPRGTGDRSLTNTEIRDKYAKLTRRIISAERRAAIEKAVLGIDTLDDVAELTTPLTPAVHSPLD